MATEGALVALCDGLSKQAVKRRARMPLSCQRCRRHRSKCSRGRPSCDQCMSAEVECEYLDAPGDLESTALRDRFAGLEDQIHSLLNEFDIIEALVKENNQPNLCTKALTGWDIHQKYPSGLAIDTHLQHVQDIYKCLIQFALDNETPQPAPAGPQPAWLRRNNAIFPTIRLSHFTSLQPDSTMLAMADDPVEITQPPPPLPQTIVKNLLSLYKTCLLHGAVQPFNVLLQDMLLDQEILDATPSLQLLYASILCHMLPHAYCWHREAFASLHISEAECISLAQQYYGWAKHLLSTLYFETQNLATCHAICNLVLYHMESGNTSVIYIYSGMAVRMALSLQLYREEALDGIAQTHHETIFKNANIRYIKGYARSLLWFLYFLDTATSHFHNKPYEVHLNSGDTSTTTAFNPSLSQDDRQALFQWLEFQACQITRDIRRTCFANDAEETPYREIERIERSLIAFRASLPTLPMKQASVWSTRCLYMHWIRYHGQWILLHQTYLPTPLSLQRCTTAAFALVQLFNNWIIDIDCYFRPCIHELKQACDILLYHVDNNTDVKLKALDGLAQLIQVIMLTPVSDIAKKRPFVRRVQEALQQNGWNNIPGCS
ncbi:hypothetical protein BC940DRAFT_316767 [Gongronella butleri]|nr:hypothetical protein BC940DRAFT_316767 [Gongronella butleri]